MATDKFAGRQILQFALNTTDMILQNFVFIFYSFVNHSKAPFKLEYKSIKPQYKIRYKLGILCISKAQFDLSGNSAHLKPFFSIKMVWKKMPASNSLLLETEKVLTVHHSYIKLNEIRIN